jgi:hypothetical protein
MNMELLNEVCKQLAPMVPAFEAQHGCRPTVAIVSSALMRKLVGEIQNCVVCVGDLVILAHPTVEAIRLSALEVPASLRPAPPRRVLGTRVVH